MNKQFLILIFSFFITFPANSREPLRVVIGKQDVTALGGWPLHRKWYATAFQNLKYNGARRIFLDVALPITNPLQRESEAFLHSVLMQYPDIFLLSHSEQNSTDDSLTILGKFTFPISRFIAPFSNYIDIQGNHLRVKTDVQNSLIHHLAAKEFSERNLMISMPQEPVKADIHFTDILKESCDCQGKDVFIYLDLPGVTSYVVHQSVNQNFSTSILQTYAIKQILDGNFSLVFPQQVLLLIFLGTLLPLIFIFKYSRIFHFSAATFILMLIILILTKILKIYMLPCFYAFLLIPAAVSGLSLFRQSKANHKSEKDTEPVLPEQNPDDALLSDYRQLKEKLQFYEHLTGQKEKSGAKNWPSYIQLAPDSPLNEILEKVAQIAQTDIPVLITGDSGTGKEQIAKFLHERSKRSHKAFVAVHCASLNENLIESELFGHMPGAFTGASKLKKGKFDQANGGTLLLDEICETSLSVQVKLLRFLQEGVFERVGGIEPIQTSIRIVAATNREPLKAIKQEIFREDFYYRLNGYTITLPPLRERKMDIEHLFRHFLHTEAPEFKISRPIVAWLKEQPWPGNVRQLKAAVKRAVINAQIKKRIFLLPEDFELSGGNQMVRHPDLHVKILEQLREDGFRHRSISKVAKNLGVHRTTVIEYLRGWTIRFLQRSDMDDESVFSAIAGDAELENSTKFRERIEIYIESLRKNILSGIQANKSSEQIKRISFKKLPSEFEKDFVSLVEKMQPRKM